MSFRSILFDALSDLAAQGYISPEQVEDWVLKLYTAADAELGPDPDTAATMAMRAAQARVEAKLGTFVPGISRYTLAMVAPHLRSELDRRIMAATDLIKLRRREAVAETLRRFRGWATSIPPGGDRTANRRQAASHIGKGLRQLPFEQRRMLIDQGHKLIANVADIVAMDAGAIAAVWHSHFRQVGYNFRPEHKERDGRVYAIRDNWAIKRGLMNKGAGYTDAMTKPGQEIACRCNYQYITALRDLPDSMLTRAGQAELTRAREMVGAA